MGPKGALNLQRDQVNSKCEEFAEQGGEFFETTLNNSSDRILDGFDAETADGISTANPMTSKKMNTSFPVQAEMLSPDETVQLLANVMQTESPMYRGHWRALLLGLKTIFVLRDTPLQRARRC